MKSIIAPTDFSAISVNAVLYAADMACATGNSLVLLHVCPPPLVFSEIPASSYPAERTFAEAEQQIEELKESLSIRTGGHIPIITEIRQGNVVDEIGEYCSAHPAYAVVMGAERAGMLERILEGGKTITAINQLSWPLIIIPPEAKFTSIRKIGLACDFRKVVETIPTREIHDLATKFHAELHVLHVSNETGATFSPVTIEESAWLQDIIGDLKPVYHFINGTEIEKEVTAFAHTHNLDMLIVIPKRHNLVERIFGHSHSKRMALHSHIPVLSIHE